MLLLRIDVSGGLHRACNNSAHSAESHRYLFATEAMHTPTPYTPILPPDTLTACHLRPAALHDVTQSETPGTCACARVYLHSAALKLSRFSATSPPNQTGDFSGVAGAALTQPRWPQQERVGCSGHCPQPPPPSAAPTDRNAQSHRVWAEPPAQTARTGNGGGKAMG
jgi:hypothetical protein